MKNFDVFISYARSSSFDEAHQLANLLNDNGVSTFIDDRMIPAGSAFPKDIAEGILHSRVMVVFVEPGYFERHWCVCEYQLGVSLYRKNTLPTTADDSLNHMVIALPAKTDLDAVIAHLPPPLATLSWPQADDTNKLVSLVEQRLANTSIPIGKQLEGFDDYAVKMLIDGGSIPAASSLKNIPCYQKNMPDGLGHDFVGRQDILWKIFHSLETNAVAGNAASCVLQGVGGSGKTQIAAEYVWRYGALYYTGGLIWLNADCDDEELVEQLYDIVKLFIPAIAPLNELGSNISQQYTAVSSHLTKFFNEREGNQAILWVVDNLPEPRKGKSLKPLKYWCPVEPYVRVLSTTRRSKVKAGTRVTVSEFSPENAIEMLTRAGVERSWLADDEWVDIVKWVGCLPLALKIMHTSLSEKFISAHSLLKKTRGEEPVSYLTEELESLREEVEEAYLQGVTETFHMSYSLLAEDNEALTALQLFAFLSFVAIPDSLLTLVLSEKMLGKLANRSWIQFAESAKAAEGERYWQMHRIVASYVRSQTTEPIVVIGMMADWLTRAFESDLNWRTLKRCNPHLFRLRNNAHAFLVDDTPETYATVDKINVCGQTVATSRLGDRELDGARYLGAGLVYWTDHVTPLLDQLEFEIAKNDPGISCQIPHILQVFPKNEQAAHLFVKLLSSEDLEVRRKAMVYLGSSQRPDIVAFAFLEALIDPTHENIVDHVITGFEALFSATSPTLDPILTRLLELVDGGLYRGGVAAMILSRVFACFGVELATDNFDGIGLAREMMVRMKNSADEQIALQLADGLGRVDNDDIYAGVIDLLSDEDEPDTELRCIKVVDRYLHTRTYPPTPKISVEWTEEGGMVLNSSDGGFFPSKKARPELNRPLGDFVMKAVNPDLFEQALEIICQSSVGKYGLMEAVYEAIDAGEYQRVITTAEKAIEYSPDFSSPYMWRSACYEALGQFDKALSDQTMLIKMTADLPVDYRAEYLITRAKLFERLNDINGAIDDYSAAIELLPEDGQLYQYRGYLYNLINSRDKAVADFSEAVKLNPEDTYSLYNKAMNSYERGEYGLALEDFAKLLSVDKTHHAAWYAKGVCHLNLQQNAEAIESLSHAIRLDEGNAEYYYIRGAARFRMGLKNDAQRDAEYCINLKPDHSQCSKLLNLIKGA